MGLDVMTIPPKVAAEFLELGLSGEQMQDKTHSRYTPDVDDEASIDNVRLDTLWDVPQALVECVDQLEKEDLDTFDAQKLFGFFAEYGCADVLVNWTNEQIATSRAEGKIPNLENWKKAFANKEIGLDALMNLAGLNSFKMDQEAMDQRITDVLAKG